MDKTQAQLFRNRWLAVAQFNRKKPYMPRWNCTGSSANATRSAALLNGD